MATSNSEIAALKILEALNIQPGSYLTLTQIFNDLNEDLFFDSNMNPVELMSFLRDINFVDAKQNGIGLKYSITPIGVQNIPQLRTSIATNEQEV
jgi:hypothetical protein